MRSLTVEPLIPLALWLTLALVAAGLLVWYGIASRRRLNSTAHRVMLALMAASIALPLAILLNPTWTEQLPPPAGKPLVTILVDDSSSMATRDAAAGASRLAAARQFAETMAERLADRYDVRTLAFDQQARGIAPAQLASLAAHGALTDLGQALRAAVDDDRPQGQFVVLASDGIHNAGAASGVIDAANRARALSAPVYVMPLGGPATVRDLDVRFVTPQELAFAGAIVPVTVKLSQHGLAGATTRLRLTLDDGDAQSREIETRNVELSSQREATVSFELRQAKAGLYRYELEAAAIDGEVTPLNNHATLLLRVVDEPIRVLLLEGKPYWDTRFLLRTLLDDRSLELDSVVRMAEQRLLQQTFHTEQPAAPDAQPTADGLDAPAVRQQQWQIVDTPSVFLGAPERLAKYQIIVLGRDADVFLDDTAIANLKTWMTRGGGSLVCFRGTPTSQVNQQLQALLPVRWSAGRESRFRVHWTERGKQLNWLPEFESATEADPLAQLPSLATTTAEKQPKPLAVVLASSATDDAASQPVIAYQPVGNGRAVVVEGAGMWRWAFLAPQHQDHASIYSALWRSLTRWLVAQSRLLPGQDRLLRTDKVQFVVGDVASATLQVRDDFSGDLPRIELSADGQPPQTFVPSAVGDEAGTFRVAFGHLAAGRYRAHIVGAEPNAAAESTSFDVRPQLTEQLDVSARPDLLEQIARRTGGAVVDGNDPGQFVRQLDEHLHRLQPSAVRQTPAWDRWWVIVGVCGIWATTWAMRRWRGLV